MKLADISKSIRQNAAAIITALIVFLLVTNYLAFIVPKNEGQIDNYNRSTLEEFNLQFNNTLKDYSNQVDLSTFKNSLAREARKMKFKASKPDSAKQDDYDQQEINFLDSVGNVNNTALYSKLKENIIIQSISIDSILNGPGEIEIVRKINFKFCSNILNRYKIKHPDSERLKKLCCLLNRKTVRKSELINRLSGAIVFKDWMIYTTDKKEFLNKNIDLQEFDSIAKSASNLGILTFTFSDKRFYKQSFAVEGTDFQVFLIGAVSQKEFQAKAKMVDVNILTICILLVVLLFLCIPLLKPIISSSKEKLTQLDLLNTTTGIGVFTIVLAAFIFTNYLSGSYQNSIKNDLMGLHNQVKQSLQQELDIYNQGFNAVQNKLDPKDTTYYHTEISTLPALNNPQLRKDLQNYFTFSKEGDIVKNISDNKNYVLRKNFAERPYFKDLKTSTYNSILTAVYSKNDNKYKLVYIIKRDKGALSGFAFVPEFNTLNKVDGTTGFMLCNKAGRVILHSDSTKSLNENIYTYTQKDPELSKLFHGMNDTCFEMNYNGDMCLFYGKKLEQANTASPLYLLTYKNLNFANSLKIYTIVNGFIISLAYVLSVTFLMLCFSAFFYLGNIPVLSRYHVSWLFPDNSRETEYKLLRKVNFAAFLLFFLMFVWGNDNLLYFAMLTGINISFFAFVLLNQRVFVLFDGSVYSRNKLLQLIAFIFGFGYLIPFIMHHSNFPAMGLTSSLFGHLIYLYYLRKDTQKAALPKDQPLKSSVSKRNSFIGFFSSVISYHYLLVPSIVLLGLFNHETKKMNNFQDSAEKLNTAQTLVLKDQHVKADERFYNSIEFVQPPSKKLIERIDFDVYYDKDFDTGFKKFIFESENLRATLMVFFLLILTMLMIKRLINFYAGRFFFFDLCEAYRLGYFETTNEFANFKIILPPFNNKDLEALEKYERFAADEEKELKQRKWLEEIPGNIVSNTVKMELIMMDNFRTYQSQYKQAWNTLSDDEKFAMHDFAIDHFVNYKNKSALMSLMEKGFIIADPLTGRLRVMNYGFRNFVTHLFENNPEVMEQMEDEKIQGTFSKWKFPIIIVACSALLLVMYLNKESFNQILFVGGSVVSAMGLIAKFLDTTKK